MRFFYRLEHKYGRYAIPNLMYYIVMMYAVGLVIQLLMPGLYWQWLCLDAEMILRGQIWRIVTFMMCPPSQDVFFAVIAMFMYYSLGQTLERVWGAFRFNVYFFIGVLGHVAAALVGYAVFGERWILTTDFLNFSLFLAFALTFPDVQFRLFFVLPIKAKWLAVAEVAVYVVAFINGSPASRCEIAMSLLNVILFVALTFDYRKLNPKQRVESAARKRNFQKGMKIAAPGQTRHRCAVCGRTEKDGENLEFRYCSKCEGNFEYCQDHLYTHIHVTKDSQNS